MNVTHNVSPCDRLLTDAQTSWEKERIKTTNWMFNSCLTSNLILLYSALATTQLYGMERLSLSENKVVVAVDFGTTYSGVSWAKIGDVCRKTY